jgi:hypothetical protein
MDTVRHYCCGGGGGTGFNGGHVQIHTGYTGIGGDYPFTNLISIPVRWTGASTYGIQIRGLRHLRPSEPVRQR